MEGTFFQQIPAKDIELIKNFQILSGDPIGCDITSDFTLRNILVLNFFFPSVRFYFPSIFLYVMDMIDDVSFETEALEQEKIDSLGHSSKLKVNSTHSSAPLSRPPSPTPLMVAPMTVPRNASNLYLSREAQGWVSLVLRPPKKQLSCYKS